MSLQKVKSHLDEDRQKKIAIKSDQFISRLCPKWLKIWLFLQVFIGMQTGLSANKLWAQSEKLTFQHFTVDEGLSHNSVNCILQDHEGYLWIGTQDGLNRFDGYEFVIFYHDPADEKSLAHNQVSAIHEDRSGNLWIGTFNALNRYERQTGAFTKYSFINISTIFEDPDGLLWLGSDSILVRYDVVTQKSTYFASDSLDPARLSDSWITCSLVDKSGVAWFGSQSGGLNRYNPEHNYFLHFINEPQNTNSLSYNQVTSVCEDSTGFLWVGTYWGLNCLDRNTGNWKQYYHDSNNPFSLGSNAILTLMTDRDGQLWIGTDKSGIDKFNPKSGKFSHYKNQPEDPTSPGDNTINMFYQDRFGIIWVATHGGGLEKINLNQIRFSRLKLPGDSQSQPDENVWCLYEDRNARLWIGTDQGLTRLQPSMDKNQTSSTYKKNPNFIVNLPGQPVRCISEDEDGTLWLGTLGGGIFELDTRYKKLKNYRHGPDIPQQLGSNDVYAIYNDDEDILWLGTNGCGLEKFDKKTRRFLHLNYSPPDSDKIISRWILDICKPVFSARPTLWLATWGQGLAEFDPEQETFNFYPPYPGQSNNPNSNIILSIYASPDSLLWLGTHGGGLLAFNPKTKQFSSYTIRDGMSSNLVYNVLEDNSGNLWISTGKGLTKFDHRFRRFRNFSLEDGLLSNDFNLGACLKSSTGYLLFGSDKGIVSFFPQSFFNEVPPMVHLTHFKMFGNRVKLTRPLGEMEKIQIPYHDNNFSFEFIALHYADSKANQYAYKLEGFDPDWIFSGNRAEAPYSNLSPGKYIFRVKAANSDGFWNETGAAIRLQITPPFYRTTWFFLVMLGSLIFATYGLYRYGIHRAVQMERARISAQEKLREKLAKDFHDELGARVTRISWLGKIVQQELPASTPEALALLTKITDNADSLLGEMKNFIWEIDPQKDTLYELAAQLKKISDQLFDKADLAFQIIGIQPEFEQIHLPMFWRQQLLRIFKEGLTNILKHSQQCRNVTLTFKLKADELEIVLMNDGIGFDVARCQPGNGLKNMHQRAESVGGRLTIESEPQTGTRISFQGKLP